MSGFMGGLMLGISDSMREREDRVRKEELGRRDGLLKSYQKIADDPEALPETKKEAARRMYEIANTNSHKKLGKGLDNPGDLFVQSVTQRAPFQNRVQNPRVQGGGPPALPASGAGGGARPSGSSAGFMGEAPPMPGPAPAPAPSMQVANDAAAPESFAFPTAGVVDQAPPESIGAVAPGFEPAPPAPVTAGLTEESTTPGMGRAGGRAAAGIPQEFQQQAPPPWDPTQQWYPGATDEFGIQVPPEEDPSNPGYKNPRRKMYEALYADLWRQKAHMDQLIKAGVDPRLATIGTTPGVKGNVFGGGSGSQSQPKFGQVVRADGSAVFAIRYPDGSFTTRGGEPMQLGPEDSFLLVSEVTPQQRYNEASGTMESVMTPKKAGTVTDQGAAVENNPNAAGVVVPMPKRIAGTGGGRSPQPAPRDDTPYEPSEPPLVPRSGLEIAQDYTDGFTTAEAIARAGQPFIDRINNPGTTMEQVEKILDNIKAPRIKDYVQEVVHTPDAHGRVLLLLTDKERETQKELLKAKGDMQSIAATFQEAQRTGRAMDWYRLHGLVETLSSYLAKGGLGSESGALANKDYDRIKTLLPGGIKGIGIANMSPEDAWKNLQLAMNILDREEQSFWQTKTTGYRYDPKTGAVITTGSGAQKKTEPTLNELMEQYNNAKD